MPESETTRPPKAFHCKIIQSDSDFQKAADDITKNKTIYVDTESNGLAWWQYKPEDIAGVSISTQLENYWFPINMVKYRDDQVNLSPKKMKLLLKDCARERRINFVYGNAKIDWHILSCLGLNLSTQRNFTDVLLWSHLININDRHGVKFLGGKLVEGASFWEEQVKALKRTFGLRIDPETGKDNKFDYRRLPLELIGYYAACDTFLTKLIHEHFLANPVLDDFKEYAHLEHEVSRSLFVTENTGIKVDIPYFEQLQTQLDLELLLLEKGIFEDVGKLFNINSTPQLVDVLYNHLGLPKQYTKDIKTRKMHVSTNKTAMFMLKDLHPAIPKLQERRKKKKIKEYVDKILANVDANSRIHTNFNQFKENTDDLRTGRLSSSNPINFENIPNADKSIRRGFLPDEEFVFLDWNNQEGRIYAHYADEQKYKQVFLNGGDSHAITCEAIYGIDYETIIRTKKTDPEIDRKRNISKRMFFRLLYGGGAERGAETLAEYGEKYDVARAAALDKRLKKNLPNFEPFFEKVMRVTRKRGYIHDIHGRRYIPKMGYDGRPKYYAMPNFLIQGTAGGMLKKTIITIASLYGNNVFANFIHDENVFDRLGDRSKVKVIKEIMEDFPQLSIPMLAECAFTKGDWSTKEEIKDLDKWTKSI